MKFNITAILALILYSSVTFASLRNPNEYWEDGFQMAAAISCATAFVVAFHRRDGDSGPLFAFGIFSLLLGFFSRPPFLREFASWLIETLAYPGGSSSAFTPEFNSLYNILGIHFGIVMGLAAMSATYFLASSTARSNRDAPEPQAADQSGKGGRC